MTVNHRFAWVVALGVLCAFSAAASPIFVTNFSFETLPVGGLNNGTCGAGFGCYSVGATAIPGWSGSNAGSGEYQPTTPAIFNTITNGVDVGFSNRATVFQIVA